MFFTGPLTPKRGNKDFYKGEPRQLCLLKLCPGKHVIRGASKYRLLDEKVRVFVAPSIEEIKKSELKPYVGKDVKLTMVQKRELWNIMPKSPASSQSAPSS
ncbi:hypothetical protein DFJ58DRAFT_785954 [Suillus subalutaceus]|uniref:uncharacterized protein n=1 Tax=Suillus subalutaceus TaxID=48586 RepID=UPI001B872113|nr:uncharacterized protein DFJ58DRAFT_785954 [Suillus subalutaceus]KAG1855687.1 hypothetical protein DFJ58DRAFT_785954 [Suillus subalutaceus]